MALRNASRGILLGLIAGLLPALTQPELSYTLECAEMSAWSQQCNIDASVCYDYMRFCEVFTWTMIA